MFLRTFYTGACGALLLRLFEFEFTIVTEDILSYFEGIPWSGPSGLQRLSHVILKKSFVISKFILYTLCLKSEFNNNASKMA